MKSLRSIVSTISRLDPFIMLLEHASRRFCRLCIWLQRGSTNLFLSGVSQPEYTLQALASVVWRFDLCISLFLVSQSGSSHKKTARARLLALIHDCCYTAKMRNWCTLICPRRWTGKLDSTCDAGWRKKFHVFHSQRGDALMELWATLRAGWIRCWREKKGSSSSARWPQHLIIISSHIFYCSGISLGMRGSECQLERCDKIKESLQIWYTAESGLYNTSSILDFCKMVFKWNYFCYKIINGTQVWKRQFQISPLFQIMLNLKASFVKRLWNQLAIQLARLSCVAGCIIRLGASQIVFSILRVAQSHIFQ